MSDIPMDHVQDMRAWQERRGTLRPPARFGPYFAQLEAGIQRHLDPDTSPYGYDFGRTITHITDYAMGLYRGGRPFVATELLSVTYAAITSFEHAYRLGHGDDQHPDWVDDELWDDIEEQLHSPILRNVWVFLRRLPEWWDQRWPVYDFMRTFGVGLLIIQRRGQDGDNTIGPDLEV